MNWKRYVVTLISLGCIVTVVQSCMESKPARKHVPIPRITPTPVVATPTPQPQNENMYAYVNENIYQSLKAAKNNFERLLQNGDVAQQLRSHGIDVSHEQAQYLRSHVDDVYNIICSYVQAYENGDYNTCCQQAESLYGYYYYALGRSVLYSAIVKPALPDGYQDDIDFNQPYDGNGNICLQNGRKLCVLGNGDDLITPDLGYSDIYTDMTICASWFAKVPSLLYDYYCTMYNTDGNNEVCYVINKARAERFCSAEMASVKQEGSQMYGFNPIDTRIIPNGYGYSFRGPDDEYYGDLTDEQVDRINAVFTVQDVIYYSYSGSASQVDYCLDRMSGTQKGVTYAK